jgi:hypothetical protein
VHRGCEDLFDRRLELPTMDSLFLDLILGKIELFLPVGEHIHTLLDDSKSFRRGHLEEDFVDLNVSLYLDADFC